MTTCAGQEVVSPGYFEALGIPLVEGRYLDDGDNDDPGRASVVVSRAFAERFWPGENALGKGVNPGGIPRLALAPGHASPQRYDRTRRA